AKSLVELDTVDDGGVRSEVNVLEAQIAVAVTYPPGQHAVDEQLAMILDEADLACLEFVGLLRLEVFVQRALCLRKILPNVGQDPIGAAEAGDGFVRFHAGMERR